MLVELALGDSYGAGREYVPDAVVKATNDGVSYIQHQKWADLKPGRYTDDTQMTIGLAEFMLSGKAPTAYNLAEAFLSTFQRDPRAGYAAKFYEILQRVKTPYDLLRILQPQSDRSGAAMRASPCGLLPTVEEAIDYAVWQGTLTHATRDGLGAAAGAAALTWACRQGYDRGFLPQFLDDTVPGFYWSVPWVGKVGAPGLESTKAALAAVVAHDNLHDMLRACIAFTGDVDTVATIALAAASLHPGMTSNLAQSLYDGLEPGGQYGLAYLRDLDVKLMAKYPGPVQAMAFTEWQPEQPEIEDLFPPGSSS